MRLNNSIIRFVDELKIRSKLIIFYVFCVIVPLIVTDGVIFYIIGMEQKTEINYEVTNNVNTVEADFTNLVQNAVGETRGIYLNWDVNEFLDYDYASEADYVTTRYEMISQPFSEIVLGSRTFSIVMYAANPTIISGGPIRRLDTAYEEDWYKALSESANDMILYCYYSSDNPSVYNQKRKISIIRRLNYYKNLNYEKVVKVDIDYGTVVDHLNALSFSEPVYICVGDKIICSNRGHSDLVTDYESLSGEEKIAGEKDFSLYGLDIRVIALRDDKSMLGTIRKNFPLIILLVLVNIILPALLMNVINHSFVMRIGTLSDAFDRVKDDSDSFQEISDVSGSDEIGNLMRNYNKMVQRLKELIRTVYEDRLERQEMDIERQQAELEALHSQINPHFLFNVLESIRMHSIIKQEHETARMIERLAILERQNVDWSNDYIRIKEEIKFVEAYLDLQKYRFGDRLNYQISLKNGCENYFIPKLTLATFVENACVHGAENKAGTCFIYVRIYEQADMLYLEVEDTGKGIDEEAVEALNNRLKNCTIDDLRNGKHVGMINACLRLKMTSSDRAQFLVESEKGIGTTILISIPLDTLRTEL